MTRTKANVKTCPFCGGWPRIESSSRYYKDGNKKYVSFVRCVDCNARSQRVPNDVYGQRKAVEIAIMLWNATMPKRETVVISPNL